MSKRVAVIFSGGLKQFTRRTEQDSESCSDAWKRIVDKYDADVFAYVDDNDFFYNDVQYFSDKNGKNTVDNQDCRYHHNVQNISYDDAYPIIKSILQDAFGEHLKDYKIEDAPEDSSFVYNENNSLHKAFFESNETKRPINSKYAILGQFRKVYECFKLLEKYEEENGFKYDIVIRTRPDIKVTIDKIDIREVDLTKTLCCNMCPWHIYDWWAAGNRDIMKVYSDYYEKYMSINLKYKKHLWLYHHNGNHFDWEIYEDEPTKYKGNTDVGGGDASDSSEFGLHYLIGTMFGYNFQSYGIKYTLNKYYK